MKPLFLLLLATSTAVGAPSFRVPPEEELQAWRMPAHLAGLALVEYHQSADIDCRDQGEGWEILLSAAGEERRVAVEVPRSPSAREDLAQLAASLYSELILEIPARETPRMPAAPENLPTATAPQHLPTTAAPKSLPKAVAPTPRAPRLPSAEFTSIAHSADPAPTVEQEEVPSEETTGEEDAALVPASPPISESSPSPPIPPTDDAGPDDPSPDHSPSPRPIQGLFGVTAGQAWRRGTAFSNDLGFTAGMSFEYRVWLTVDTRWSAPREVELFEGERHLTSWEMRGALRWLASEGRFAPLIGGLLGVSMREYGDARAFSEHVRMAVAGLELGLAVDVSPVSLLLFVGLERDMGVSSLQVGSGPSETLSPTQYIPGLALILPWPEKK